MVVQEGCDCCVGGGACRAASWHMILKTLVCGFEVQSDALGYGGVGDET